MGKREGVTYWNIPVSKTLNEAVERAIELGTYSTKSDFVRGAVREKLASMGYKSEPFK